MSESSEQSRYLLGDLRVLELASFVFGPAAATVMADFGAEVIKIEPPFIGDVYRYIYNIRPMPISTTNYCWMLTGRNKRSIALNVKSEEGRDVLNRLLASADVLITNYHPQILEKLLLRYEDLAEKYPRLIYAQASGFGEHGPEAGKPGYDVTTYWARSGLMDTACPKDSDPSLAIPGLGDHPSAMTLFGGIMLALYQREKNGRGTKVASSLLGNGAWAVGCFLQGAMVGAEFCERFERKAAVNPLANYYATRDGKRMIILLVQGDKDFPILCGLMGRSELAEDPRFSNAYARQENREALIALLDDVFIERDFAEWRELLEKAGLVFSLVPTMQDVAQDPQMVECGAFVEMHDPKLGAVRTIDSPLELAGVAKVPPKPGAAVGEDTQAVLRSLGYDEAKIRSLFEASVVSTSSPS